MSRRRIPLDDATAPVACTLVAGELEGRIGELRALAQRALSAERTEHGVVVRFPAPLVDDVERFVADESACCGFWGFALDRSDGELQLRWDAPPAAAGLLDDLLVRAGLQVPPAPPAGGS